MNGRRIKAVNKPWYYRMLLSYIPIFFIITTFLFFIFFQEINSMTEKDAVKANQYIAQQAMDRLEYNLRLMENAVEEFISSNTELENYLKDSNNVYKKYQALKEFASIRQRMPSIDSIYLVRNTDQIVLGEKSQYPLKQHPDYDFFSKLDVRKQSFKWTEPRSFTDITGSKPREVISLVRTIFPYYGLNDYIIVNVKASIIRSQIEQTVNPNVHFVRILGKNGNDISQWNKTNGNNDILSQLTSPYTNWTYQSGLIYGGIFNAAAFLSGIWMKLGIASVILGIISIIYVTRKNYRPLESLVSQLLNVLPSSRQQPLAKGHNEFQIIESAIESMILRSDQFEQQRDEGMKLHKKYFFYDLIEGSRDIDPMEWQEEAGKNNIPNQFSQALVVTLELDRYAHFTRNHTQSDQLLFKYAMMNAAHELFHDRSLEVWSEWTSGKRVVLLVLSAASRTALESSADAAVTELISWMEGNLPLSVTAGLGSSVEQLPDIAASYRKSFAALNYKAVKGSGRVLRVEDPEAKGSVELYHHLEQIRSLVYSLRMGEEDWKEKFEFIFTSILEDQLAREEICSLMRYLVFQVDKRISEIAGEMKTVWLEKGMNPLIDAIDSFETLNELHSISLERLTDIAEQLSVWQEGSQQRILIMQVKEYIKHNFANPDMSLVHLSDVFNVSAKYISQLFKDEFNENFIDYLINQRMESAKEWLNTSEKTVQDIALQVGYSNAISFTRSFKKVIGLAPGDYRKRTGESLAAKV